MFVYHVIVFNVLLFQGHCKTSYWHIMFLCYLNIPLPRIFVRICVVYHHTFSLAQRFISSGYTLLPSMKYISVNVIVIPQMRFGKVRLSRARTSDHEDQLKCLIIISTLKIKGLIFFLNTDLLLIRSELGLIWLTEDSVFTCFFWVEYWSIEHCLFLA